MKATLEFTLPEDREEYDQTVHASDYSAVIFDMLQQLRTVYKHGEDAVAAEHAQKWADVLRDILAEYGVGDAF